MKAFIERRERQRKDNLKNITNNQNIQELTIINNKYNSPKM